MRLFFPIFVIVKSLLCGLTTVLSAPVYARKIDPYFFTGVSQAHLSFASLNNLRPSRVFPLVFSWKPLAVSGFIISVIIDTFYGVAVWSNTHIFEKIGKTVSPPIAHPYTPTPIVLELNTGLPVAARVHVLPSAISSSHFRFGTEPVISASPTKRQAPTTKSLSGSKCVKPEPLCGTTVALGIHPSGSFWVHGKDDETPVSLSNGINRPSAFHSLYV